MKTDKRTGRFIVIDVDSFELKIGITVVGTGRIDAMFIGDDFPELREKQRFVSSPISPSSAIDALWNRFGFHIDQLEYERFHACCCPSACRARVCVC